MVKTKISHHFSNSIDSGLNDILLIEEESSGDYAVECDACDSTGFIMTKTGTARVCAECKEKRILAIRRSKLSNIPMHLRKFPLKFDVPVRLGVLDSEFKVQKLIIENEQIENKFNVGIFKLLNNGTSFFIFGNNGCGKTMVACSIAVKTIEDGGNAIFVMSPELFDMAFSSGNSNGSYRQIFTSDLLIIDDFGAEYVDSKNFKASFLNKVLITRATRKKPTIITSSLVVPSAIEDIYGKKVANTIMSNFVFLQLATKESYSKSITVCATDEFIEV